MTPKQATVTLVKDLGMEYPNPTSKAKSRFGIYLCPVCENEFKTYTYMVNSGKVTKCRDCKHKAVGDMLKSHGMSNTKIYRVWRGMKNRCTNKNSSKFIHYGGRGISMCDEWLNDFTSFYNWALNNGYTEGLSIDRIDNNGNYEPSNCRWTTQSIQSSNTRKLHSDNTSGYRGVYFDNTTKRWVSSIHVDKKRIYLGKFKTALEGAIAYDKYVDENNLEHTMNGVLHEEN